MERENSLATRTARAVKAMVRNICSDYKPLLSDQRNLIDVGQPTGSHRLEADVHRNSLPDDQVPLLTSPCCEHLYTQCHHTHPLSFPATTASIRLINERMSY